MNYLCNTRLNQYMGHEKLFLLGYIILVAIILVLDLDVIGKSKNVDKSAPAPLSIKKAAWMSGLVIFIAILFYAFLYYFGHYLHGIENFQELQTVTTKYHQHIRLLPDIHDSIRLYDKNLALEYITGYVIEYALSVDNIFVILMIFTSFKVPSQYYEKVLLYGILGAIVLRFAFIFAGASLINRFDWIMYVFGAFLLFTGLKMFRDRNKKEEMDTANHPVVKFATKHFKVHHDFVGDNFLVKLDGIRKITPLFLVLLIIEFTDLLFAVDSIPAIFSVTKDPYIVFFSNIFAVIGLRSMFFLLAGIVDKFRYLKVGLAALLIFIGVKMLAHDYLDDIGFDTTDSLFVILAILAISILSSVIFKPKQKV